MECIPLDLTIISAEDLKDVQMIGKQDVYAVVSINGDARTKQKTPVDKDCGTKPKWKHHAKLTLDDAAARENRLTLVFQIFADRPIAGDKVIGEVNIPVKELLDQSDPKSGEEEKTVTYAVRQPNGKPKGSLKISFKFGEKFTYEPNGPGVGGGPGPSTVDHKTLGQTPMAYPPGPPAYGGGPYAPPAAGPSGYPPPGHDDKHSGPPGYAYPPQGGYPGYPLPGHDDKHGGPGYAYPPPGGYPQTAPGYPPHGGYPPQTQQGYPGYPPAPGYGYPGYPAPGPYGYPQQQAVQGKPQKPKKHGSSGLGLGLGLGAGLLGGLLVGEAISDVAETAEAFDDGFDF